MNTFLIGDTHFCHANIIRYCNRPFKTVQEMNQAIVDNWNDIVKPNDQVFVLGDFCLGNKKAIIEMGQMLNGHKNLILGNHDRGSMNAYREAGFESISKYPILLHDYFLLSHAPLHTTPDGLYANIFAHVHDDPKYLTVSQRSYCVSAERIDYTPVDFDYVCYAMENAEKSNDSDHFDVTYNIDKSNRACSSYALAPNGAPICMNTKELDCCECGGNKDKCDFYTWAITD